MDVWEEKWYRKKKRNDLLLRGWFAFAFLPPIYIQHKNVHVILAFLTGFEQFFFSKIRN